MGEVPGYLAQHVLKCMSSTVPMTPSGTTVAMATATQLAQLSSPSLCRFERPFFERSAMEGAAGILNMRINTLPEDEGNAVFSPELPNNPFTWTHNFIMVTDGDSLDRETRDFYSLPIMSTSRNGDNAYATVSPPRYMNGRHPQYILSLASGHHHNNGCE